MVETIAPDVRRLTAPNPSPMTYHGTNTYIVGAQQVIVIDPGPNNDQHLQAILAVVKDLTLAAILVTHSHVDHSPLAGPLSRATGADVYAFGPSAKGRSQMMQDLADAGQLQGGEGIDATFAPDHELPNGATIPCGDASLQAIWTPGHMSNHMCFAYRDMLFCGDHVMGWSTSLVSPPDGDLGAFMRSCETLLQRPETHYLPGHGDPITDGPARLRDLVAHRKMRESQICENLQAAPQTAANLTRSIYHDLNPALLPAAERNVLAHLLDLTERGILKPLGPISAQVKFKA